jgi:hypothetical protein
MRDTSLSDLSGAGQSSSDRIGIRIFLILGPLMTPRHICRESIQSISGSSAVHIRAITIRLKGPCPMEGRLAEPARAIDAGLPDSIRALRQQDEADAGDALS